MGWDGLRKNKFWDGLELSLMNIPNQPHFEKFIKERDEPLPKMIEI